MEERREKGGERREKGGRKRILEHPVDSLIPRVICLKSNKVTLWDRHWGTLKRQQRRLMET